MMKISKVKKFVLSIVTMCITFCSLCSSFVDIHAIDSSIPYVLQEPSKGDIVGNRVIDFSKIEDDGNLNLDYLKANLYWVMFSANQNLADNSYRYYFSLEPFYVYDKTDDLTDLPTLAVMDDGKGSVSNGFLDNIGYKEGTNYYSRFVYVDDNGTAYYNYPTTVVQSHYPTWNFDDALFSLQPNDNATKRPFIADSNFNIFFVRDNARIGVFSPKPSIGEGNKINIAFDRDHFSNVYCDKYPEDELLNGSSFGIESGEDIVLTFKLTGENSAYATIDDINEQHKAVKISSEKYKITIPKISDGPHNVVLYFGESSSSWLDIIIDFFNGLFGGIFDIIVDAFSFIFIPEDGFFEDFFGGLMEFLNRKLGILMYPFTLTIDILSKVVDIPNGSGSLHLPQVKFMNNVLIPEVNFNLKKIFTDNFSSLYNIYLSIVDCIFIFSLVGYGRKVFNDTFRR